MDLKKIAAIIPSRYGSTRFPGKPLADIGGKPMIQRVYEQASKVLETVFVATDDERIFKAVKAFGGHVVMTSVDHQSGTDRCAEALQHVMQLTQKDFEVVVNVQGDEPFIDPQQIEQLCACFDDESTDIATLVKAINDNSVIFNPNKVKVVIGKDWKAQYFSRSPIPYLRNVSESEWHLRHTYFVHLGLYAYRTHVLKDITNLRQSPLEIAESLEQLRWIQNGYNIRVRETDQESIGIDTPEDLEMVKRKGLLL